MRTRPRKSVLALRSRRPGARGRLRGSLDLGARGALPLLLLAHREPFGAPLGLIGLARGLKALGGLELAALLLRLERPLRLFAALRLLLRELLRLLLLNIAVGNAGVLLVQ